jgi:hypothetical protein
MKHLTEEQLVWFYYRELEDPAGVEEHLAGCNSCRAAYRELESLLKQVEAPVPERGGEYPSQVWHRLRPRLEPRSVWAWPRWVLAAAMAGLVVAAFLAGRFWPGQPRPTPQPITQAVRERILLVAVSDHLERSQMVLLELINNRPNGPVDISAEQQRAEDLVTANRLYRQTAASAGEAGLASVLEELERTLVELVHRPAELSSQDFEELRGRIEAQGILFKIRIIDSQVRQKEQTIRSRS